MSSSVGVGGDDNREWLEAPFSPLSDAQVKALAAAQVADPGFQPNEIYLTKKDSLCMHGETACQAIEALVEARSRLERVEAEQDKLQQLAAEVYNRTLKAAVLAPDVERRHELAGLAAALEPFVKEEDRRDQAV